MALALAHHFTDEYTFTVHCRYREPETSHLPSYLEFAFIFASTDAPTGSDAGDKSRSLQRLVVALGKDVSVDSLLEAPWRAIGSVLSSAHPNIPLDILVGSGVSFVQFDVLAERLPVLMSHCSVTMRHLLPLPEPVTLDPTLFTREPWTEVSEAVFARGRELLELSSSQYVRI